MARAEPTDGRRSLFGWERMGPLWSPLSDAGKVFAGAYALYSGVAVLAFASVVLAPIGHRLLHRFHAEDEPEPDDPAPTSTRLKDSPK
jgi:hypothetical protein